MFLILLVSVVLLIKDSSLCNIERLLQKAPTNQNIELQSSIPVDIPTKQLLHLILRNYCGIGGGKIVGDRWLGTLLPKKSEKLQATPRKMTPVWLPKHDLNKEHKIDNQYRSSWSSTLHNYKQIRNSESRRNHLSQRRAHQLVIPMFRFLSVSGDVRIHILTIVASFNMTEVQVNTTIMSH